MLWALVEIVFAFLLLVGLLSLLWGRLVTGTSPIPSTAAESDVIASFIPAGFQGRILELGSGWGHLAMALARENPLCTVVAYERSFIPWLYSVLRARLLTRRNISFLHRNFFRTPLQEAEIIVVYLHSAAMVELARLLSGLPWQGAVLITNTFSLAGREPAQVRFVQSGRKAPIYLYRL